MKRLHRLVLLLVGLILVLVLISTTSRSSQQQWPKTVVKTRILPAVTTCSPVTNYFLLKTHKCASTSVQNVMYRFAWHHNLSVMLPAAGNFFTAVGWPRRPRAQHVIPHPHAQHFDVLANHIVYDPRFVTDFLGPGVTRIGLVREPLSHFISYFNFFGLQTVLKMPMDLYLNETSPASWVKVGYPTQGPLPLRNFMSVQFGLLDSDLKDANSITAFLDRTAKDFSLVLVREYMIESLVVLKNIMCWSYKDIVVFGLNKSMKNKEIISPGENATLPRRKQNHRKLSQVDYELYDRFNRSLWEQVSKIPDFAQQKETFIRTTLRVTQFCSLNNITIKLRIDDLGERSSTIIDWDFCQMGTMTDVNFNHYFLARQYPDYKTQHFGYECCKL